MILTGQWEIDSYKFLDDGRGVVVHWKSLTPEEDKLFAKYNPDLSEKYLGVHGDLMNAILFVRI